MPRESSRRYLPALQLSIERYTESVPADGRWYVVMTGEILGAFRTEKEAKTAWDRVVEESGWKPASTPVDPEEALARERAFRWARNRAG